jgi:hypothetical protein
VEQTDATPRKRKWTAWRVTKWIVRLSVAFALLEFLGGTAICGISAICPKCLQHAYITEYRLLGIPIWRSTLLSQRHGGIMSSAAFSPDIPRVSPETYREIMGHRCRHRFLRGGVGCGSGFFIHSWWSDGTYTAWSLAQPKILALEALYRAFAKTGDRQTAAALHAVISDAYPIDKNPGTVLDIVRLLRTPNLTEEDIAKVVESKGQYRPEERKTARMILHLWRLAKRLQNVQTSEEFQAVYQEFSNMPEDRPRES